MRSATLVLVLLLLAGCAERTTEVPIEHATPTGEAPAKPAYQALGFNGSVWPRLDGRTVVILDHGAFGAFDEAKKRFENLTGAKVERVSADDSGSVLQRAVAERGDPTFDVIYGIDNILWTKAAQAGIFEPYRPLLADRIQDEHVFFGANASWLATPVDHGYIAVNYDPVALSGADLATLDDVAAHASRFVTQDPRTSTPGLGYLLATIATYGEDGWKDHWRALFEGGVTIASGWTEAYEQRFSAGYGAETGKADKAIVTSYTESPAYEAFYGRAPETLAKVVLAPNATFHQVQTMGIARGANDLAAAQAWIEFTLTDEFQSLAAPGNAVYPVVRGIDTNATYGEHDPEPGTFQPADLSAERIGANVDRWVREWVDLCEAADCA